MTAVIWIDWYAYHVARFEALVRHRALQERVVGLEMVGGAGVHGRTFRSDGRQDLPIQTLLPESGWSDAGQGRIAAAVWRRLSEIDPSVILVPGYYHAPALAAAIWGKLHGRRTVLMSESSRMDHRRVWWKEGLKKVLVPWLFDWAVAGGKPHARYLQELGFPAERIARSYDVVDNRFYAELADHARNTEHVDTTFIGPREYFLYVGRLAAEKNVDGLIHAYAAYRLQCGDAALVIVGEGALGDELREMARVSPWNRDIHFTGQKTAREIALYYAFARCFVLPSTREPWGLVVNEAMAAGLPVIVSDRCGCAEDLVHDGENGFVVSPTPRRLCDAMLQIDRRAGELEAMSRRSREIIAEYSPEHWAAEVARIVQH